MKNGKELIVSLAMSNPCMCKGGFLLLQKLSSIASLVMFSQFEMIPDMNNADVNEDHALKDLKGLLMRYRCYRTWK